MKKSSLLLLLLLLPACTTLTSKEVKDLNAKDFDPIRIGSDAKSVASFLGQPSEMKSSQKFPGNDIWIYNGSDEERSQRGALLLVHEKQVVASITVIPKQTEPESQLGFLTKTKFPSSSFESVPLQRCSRDYLPLQTFYIDTKNGIFIEANRYTNEVESFSRVSPEDAAALSKDIKSCRR
jgi:hypothetical protein